MHRMSRSDSPVSAQQHLREIIDEIEHLRRELAVRRSDERPAARSVVLAYHELLERQYSRLDELPLG
jgi:hypothetical protein